MNEQQRTRSYWKKQFGKPLLLSGLSLFAATVLQAQTYAPYITNPFNTIGMGSAMKPTLVDLDNDGDLDIMAGTNGGPNGTCFYYLQNTGTHTAPDFAPGVIDPFGLGTYIGAFLSPAFVDLDNDGDLDMMTGRQDGSSIYLQNTGTASAPAFAPPVTNPFGLSDVGYLSSHAFADLDNDGDQDVLIGEYYGNIWYFPNIGTTSAPVFGTYMNFPFGLTNVGNAFKPQFVDMDQDGDKDLLAGVENGNHVYFQNTGTLTAPVFLTAEINPFGLTATLQTYNGSSPGDLDFDGDLDIISGDNSINLKYYQNTTPVPQPGNPVSTTSSQDLYICNGTSTVLTASGTATGTLGWYDAPTGGNYLGSGASYTTGPMTIPATFYVQDSTAGGASPSRVPVTVNLTQLISNQSLFTQQGFFCGNGTSVIQLGAAEAGIVYTLVNSLNITVVDGPFVGNNAPLFFTTGNQTSTRTYSIMGELISTLGPVTRYCQRILPQTITIYVSQPSTADVTTNVCYGGDHTYADGTVSTGITANESHVSTLAGQAASSCDSIVTENIVPLPELTGSVIMTICAEDQLIVNGTVYNGANPIGTEVLTGMNGCDSTVTIILNVLPAQTRSVTNTICANEEIVINGTSYNAANPTGTEVFPGMYGCDSTVTINLNVLPAVTGTLTPVVCAGETFTINGITLSAASPLGEFVVQNGAVNGCDSTVSVILTVLPALTGSVTNTICANEEIIINGTTYNAGNPSGTEVFANSGTYGCDSTVTINLTVLPELTGTYTATICPGDEITINGTVYSAFNLSGTEVFTNVGVNGCDSTVAVTLTLSMSNQIMVFAGNPALFEAEQTGADYQWINCGTNQPIAGAIAQSFTATENGSYAVIVTMNGCSDTSFCATVSSLGINELQGSQLVLYPNPAGSAFGISGLETLSGIREITLVDVNGQNVRTMHIAETTWDISTVQPGIYYVKILHEAGVEMIRLVKK